MSIVAAIKQNKHQGFRRLYMKRRVSGEYEASWQRIPQKYIKNFGTASFSIDDIKINFLKYSGLSLNLDNTDGFFSDTTERKSFFFNSTSIVRTLVKIECGYEYESSEYPTDPTVYVGLIGEDYKYVESSDLGFSTKHISSVFDEVSADELVDMDDDYTASEIMGKIRDHEDSNNVKVFQKYISIGGWNITVTTADYTFVTNAALQAMSCWDLMRKLSEAENMIAYIDRVGDFYFREKLPVQENPEFHFSGINDNDKAWGHNIIGNISVDDNIRKVYNKIRAKWDKPETIASYKIRRDDWEWGDTTSSFIYGVRNYRYENIYMSDQQASTVADTIYTEYNQPKKEIGLTAKYVPQLEINDRVSLTYKTQQVQGDTLWGFFNWGEALWGDRLGFNINIDNIDYRIINIQHDFDKFFSNFKLREI